MSRNRVVVRSQIRRGSRRASSTERLDEIHASSHEHAATDGVRQSDAIFELSLDANAPGVLKIFGAALDVGVEYKSILVSQFSTAAEIVVEILQRFVISPSAKVKYRLCEVLGRFESSQNFVRERSRVLNDNDCVLRLLQLWKPAFGLFRRIELKTFAAEQDEEDEQEGGEGGDEGQVWCVDNETHNLNVNARRFAFTKLSLSERKSLEKSFRYSTSAQRLTNDVVVQTNGTSMLDKSTETTLASVNQPVQLPVGPCLLQLKGCDQKGDRLVHELCNFNVVGRSHECNIMLSAADVCEEHCYILAEREVLTSTSNSYRMTIQPNLQSVTYLNGNLLRKKESLFPGDMLTIGSDSSYFFLYKDSSQESDRFLLFSWLSFRNNQLSSTTTLPSTAVDEDVLNEDVNSDMSTTLPPDCILDEFSVNESKDIVSFVQKIYGKILKKYLESEINLQFGTTLTVLLTRYLIDTGQCEALNELKWQISETLLTLCKKESLVNHKFVLQKLILLCVLVVEVRLHFCQSTSNQQQHDAFGLNANWCEFCDAIVYQIQEDIIHLLSENVLEKSYALFLCDPFSQNEADVNIFSMDQFVAALTDLTSLFVQIEYQSIYTLKNQILRRLIIIIAHRYVRHIISDIKSFSKWNVGIRLRANLDIFEQWLREENLQILSDCTELLNDLVNLLATPRSHLITCNWSSLKTFFPALPASLLQLILNGYDDGDGVNMKIWKASDKDKLDASFEASSALEEDMQLLMEQNSLMDKCRSSSIDTENFMVTDNFHNLLRRLDADSYGDKYNGITWCNIWRLHLKYGLKDKVSSGSKKIGVNKPQQNSGTRLGLHDDTMRSARPKASYVEAESAYFSSSTTSKDSALNETNGISDSLNFNLMCVKDTHQPYSAVSPSSFELTLKNVSNATDINHNLLNSSSNSLPFRKRKQFNRQESRTPAIIVQSKDVATRSSISTPILNGKSSEVTSNFQHQKSSKQLLIDLKDVFTTALYKDINNSIGLGIVDGLNTELNERGIYVRSVVPNGPADQDGSIHIGDCILAVNGQTLMGIDYRRATELIKQAEKEVQLMISKSDIPTALKVIASKC